MTKRSVRSASGSARLAATSIRTCRRPSSTACAAPPPPAATSTIASSAASRVARNPSGESSSRARASQQDTSDPPHILVFVGIVLLRGQYLDLDDLLPFGRPGVIADETCRDPRRAVRVEL